MRSIVLEALSLGAKLSPGWRADLVQWDWDESNPNNYRLWQLHREGFKSFGYNVIIYRHLDKIKGAL